MLPCFGERIRSGVVRVGNRESDESDRTLMVIDFFEQFFSEREYGLKVGKWLVCGVTA